MKRVLLISKDGKKREVQELPADTFRELMATGLWFVHPKPKDHEGEYEYLAELKSDKDLEREKKKAEKAFRKRVYGR